MSLFDWLIRRETIVALAIAGGLLSLAGWALTARRSGLALSVWCNRAAYAFMAVSMVLFIAAGIVRT